MVRDPPHITQNFPHLLLPPAGAVVRRPVLTSLSGGSVNRYDPSGLKYFRCITLFMKNLYSQLQRLPFSPCCRALWPHKNDAFIFFCLQLGNSSHFLWKPITAPPLSLRVSTVNDVMRMEQMLALENNTYDKYNVLWSIWLRFSSSDTLADMLSTPSSSSPP